MTLYKNIIFDWSGTLSDDFEVSYETTMRLIESFGVRRMSKEEYVKKFELPYANFYVKLGINADVGELERKFSEIQRTLYLSGMRPKVLPAAPKMLEHLFLLGKKMAVLSAHTRESLLADVKAYGFAKFFEKIVGSVRDKTLVIEGLLDELSFERHSTILVADHTHDIAAGKKAGIATAVIPSRYTERGKLKAAEPNYLMENLEDLLKIVE